MACVGWNVSWSGSARHLPPPWADCPPCRFEITGNPSFDNPTVRPFPSTLLALLGFTALKVVVLDLAEPGNSIAVRPSGTEPKVKLYMFTRVNVNDPQALAEAKRAGTARLDAFAAELEAFAAQIP